MRKLHNKIKHIQTHEAVKQLSIRKKIKSRDIKLLDVSIGRFGDIHNYYMSGIRHVVGIDPDQASLDEALRRYIQMKKKYRDLQVTLSKQYISDFLVGGDYDIVTCNFTLHYLFESPEILSNSLTNIYNCLNVGGYFIGTSIDGNKLQKLEKTDNAIYQKIDDNSYKFKLIDNKDSGNYFNEHDQVEYFVDSDEFIKQAKKIGFRIIRIKPFDTYRWDRKLFNPTEISISSLYFSFVFYKPSTNPSHSVPV